MIGQSVSHYRILEKLGGGGMGVVYRAHDEHLDRDVAIKVLRAGLLNDETARSRFRREALTLSQLNHPNIAIVHDFGSGQDMDFLVMEYVAGETLAARTAVGPLPEQELVAVGAQIAEALEEAHERNIIHRDLKPANVIVTPKGRAKVLDFGLAKLVRPTELDGETASLAETQAGTLMGTVPYMAPEQLQGKPVDSRTDIYALGALLYELATGQRPFPEKQTSQLIAAILTQAPVPPRELNGQVSQGLQAIILKALEKNPEQRYQSAKELLSDLNGPSTTVMPPVETHPSEKGLPGDPDRLGAPGPGVGTRDPRKALRLSLAALAGLILTAALLVGLDVGGLRHRLSKAIGESAAQTVSPARIKSLAVLPLENLSGDPRQEYFADGMTEELITDLARIGTLRVISRAATMRYKGTKESLPQIARDLNVDAFIEGSVLREGDRVRITAELIDAGTGQDLWAENYERDMSSVLTLQSEIAGAVAGRVRAAITPAEKSLMAKARPINPQAYDAYLKGKFFLNKMTPEGFKKGLEYMQQAIRLDPKNPMPYAGLAVAYTRIGHGSSPEIFPKARAAALKAEELGGPSAEMYLALGTVELESEWNFAAAEKDLKRAVELNPSIGEAHRNYSWYLAMRGELQQAITEMKKAREVDPLTPIFAADLGWQYWILGQNDKAMQAARQSLELQQNFNEGLAVLGFAYTEKGMYAEAIATHRKLAATDQTWKWLLPYTYARAGRRDEARKTLARMLAEKPEPTGAWAGWFLAGDYAALGEKDEAFRWLEKSYRARQSLFPWIRVDPLLRPLHSDPRFQALVRRMNFPQ